MSISLERQHLMSYHFFSCCCRVLQAAVWFKNFWNQGIPVVQTDLVFLTKNVQYESCIFRTGGKGMHTTYAGEQTARMHGGQGRRKLYQAKGKSECLCLSIHNIRNTQRDQETYVKIIIPWKLQYHPHMRCW